MSGLPDISQDHIDLIQRIARSLARTGVGKLSGPDELESQALVTLWELALAWDPASKVPFNAYVSMYGRRRLTDWLRHEHGRRTKDNTSWGDRLNGAFLAGSLNDPDLFGELRESAPGPDDVAVARETLAEVMTVVDTECTPRERAALLTPLTDDNDKLLCADWAMSQATAHTHRYQARRKLRKHLTHQ